ncbi:MAG: AEC family transporter [Brevinema sp.]
MRKVFLSFGIIIVALVMGQFFKYLYDRKVLSNKENFDFLIDTVRKIAFFGLNPIIMVNSYWIINFQDISILFLPFICIFILLLSGGLGILFSKSFKHSKEECAAMFGCATFSNLGTIGGLLSFSFLGEKAFAISAMYFVLESFYNYLFAYPVVKLIGNNFNNSINKKFRELLKDKSIIIYVSAVFIGVILNLFGPKRPTFMASYNNVMIPTVSFLLICTISFRMEFTKVNSYIREGISIIFIKFIFSPILAILVALLFKLHHLENGLVLKVLIIMTLVPCGFNSILVPTIYNADKELANSVWIFSMIALVIVIPLEYLFLGISQ